MIVFYRIGRLIQLEEVLGELNEEVGKLCLANGVVIGQSTTLTWTITLRLLVVSHVLDLRRFQTFVKFFRIANRCVSWPHNISRNQISAVACRYFNNICKKTYQFITACEDDVVISVL